MGVEGLRLGSIVQSDKKLGEWYGTVTRHIEKENTISVDILQGEKGNVGVIEISTLREITSILSRSPEVESLYPMTVVLRQFEEGKIDVYVIDRKKMYAEPGSELLSHTQSVPGEMPRKIPGAGELLRYKSVLRALLDNPQLGKIQMDRIYDILCFVEEGSI